MLGKTKICAKCKEKKSIRNFDKAEKYKGKQYYKFYCKPCYKAYRQVFRDKNRERLRETHRIWRKDNEQYHNSNRLWREKNKKTINAREKKYRENLTDNYVIRQLGLPASVCRKYPELIETKRLIIKTSRLWKTRLKTLQN